MQRMCVLGLLLAFVLGLASTAARAAGDILIDAVYLLTGNSAPIGTDAKAAIGTIVDIINGTHA